MQGRIDRVIQTRGFGFIRSNDGREVFFHRISLIGVDFYSLKEGQVVDFDLQHGEYELQRGVKGLRAANVRMPGHPTLPDFGSGENWARI